MRTSKAFGLLGAIVSIGTLGACFPTVTYDAATGSGGKATTTTSTGKSSATSTTGTGSQTASATTTTTGAQTATTATTGSGQAMCRDSCTDTSKCVKVCPTGDPCDCDGDHYYYTGDPACAAQAVAKGYKGPDCYDCNSMAKPGQTAYFTQDRGDGSYDYSCAGGGGQKQYPATSCGSPTNGVCIAGYFQPADACGMNGTFYPCMYNLIGNSCSPGTGQPNTTQACR